ncbi:hypothetical protein FQN57_003483 [Myotisia sp. PD_48]|nr:hypothetical protein FQN57_003483 [Myotisia sp. PD_48]
MYINARNDPNDAPSNKLVAGLAVLAGIILLIISFYLLQYLRARNFRPKYIPTAFLKRKWEQWMPNSPYKPVPNRTAQLSEANTTQERTNRTGANTSTTTSGSTQQTTVDRNTSVRSVMTLPSYTPSPNPSEQVIGREGERAGMDVVVEFPETGEEEEGRREEEMESLYQIRLTRRREVAEREELRRQRREARERGDRARLEELRQASRARSATNQSASTNGSAITLSAATLLAEHQSRGREKRVSSVSYAAIGHVRHDGTRLRANSQDSDSRPLLDSAAGMETIPLDSHQRRPSATSLASASSISDAESLRREPSPQMPETDVGTSAIPPPPQYDDEDWGEAPPYRPMSPPKQDNNETSGNAESRPPFLPYPDVPSIAIELATPPNSTPPTPISTIRTPPSNSSSN